ncbi:Phosphoribosylglycinamide formyltransferase [Beauveria bassiana]|uniref:Phosphoribosylglycinamide formyltransferase n=1 Tax=Beauveria bassiana (strain ARSEF 2860) TaxID=655819 RepID=J5K6U2_BEAB2|nr:phosphoribosylglycinamide formyltransferase [Beauveria bassiana ARSEF 2860]EJP69796.1 phosphoribosylglycinamide formyltransferase [Beauveria bassiana ARSEF 2860]KAH8718640.1 Phosphoribosylglycinamide formyltransferase [Beauveria bassiana]
MVESQVSPCRITVMASGFGSNFQALIDGIASGSLPQSRIIGLITNRKTAYATARADKAGIPWQYFNLISNGFQEKGETDEAKITKARQKYDAALAAKILSAPQDQRPELIVLAGWMYVFSPAFLDPIDRAGIRIINLHPAMPGEFDGANAIERAFAAFQAGTLTRTGIMAHYVIAEVDRGAPILVQEIPWEGEDLEALKEKIHGHEHALIVNATAKVAKEIIASRT